MSAGVNSNPHFFPRLHLSFTPGKKNAYLERDFWYIDNKGRKHLVRKSMVSDGLSIPRMFYRIIDPPFQSKFLCAGIVHDRICNDARDVWNAGNKEEARQLRKDGDELFYEMLLFLKCPKWKAWLMFKAVRVGAIRIGNNKRA